MQSTTSTPFSATTLAWNLSLFLTMELLEINQ